MNLRYLSRGLLAAVVAFGLSGCFEVRQKLTVHEDGDADLMLTVVVSEDLADLDDDFDFDDGESACEGDFGFEADLPPTLSKTTNIRTDEGDVLCDLTISGPIDDMIPAMEEYVSEQEDDDFILIQKLDDNRYALVGQYDFTDDSMDIDDDAGAFGNAIKRAVLAALGDAAISWQVNAPRVVETNGDMLADGTVLWDLPLAEAVSDGRVYTFEVIFETQSAARFF